MSTEMIFAEGFSPHLLQAISLDRETELRTIATLISVFMHQQPLLSRLTQNFM